MVENFGSGKGYIPEAKSNDTWPPLENPYPPEKAKEDRDRVQAQGAFDLFKLMDSETIDKIKSLIAVIDPDKVKAVMDMIETDEEGWIKIKIDLRIKK